MRIYDFVENEIFLRKGKIRLNSEQYKVIYVLTNFNIILVSNVRPVVAVQDAKTEIIPLKSIDLINVKPHIERHGCVLYLNINNCERELIFYTNKEARQFKKAISKTLKGKKLKNAIYDKDARTLALLFQEIHLINGTATLTKIFGKNVGVDTPPKKTLKQRLYSQSVYLFFKKIFKRKK